MANNMKNNENDKMKAKSWYQTFSEETPQVQKAYDQLIQSVTTQSSLDPKTLQLIYIAIKASTGDTSAVYAHVPMAKKHGASREEVRDAVIMTVIVSGIKPITTCLTQALEAYDAAV